LRANDKVTSELATVDLKEPVEWLGMFTASSPWLSRVLRNVKPMIDDDPIIEDNHFLQYKFVPKEIFNTSRLVEWCPSCFVDGQLVGELKPLGYYLRILQDIYRNPDFLKDGPFLPDKKIYRVQLSRADNGSVVPDTERLLMSPTQDQFRSLLKQYLYLTTFGPDWAVEYQP
jgi:hypothetical protein